jgi:hypothetical protein
MEEMKWSSSDFHDLLCWLQSTLNLAWLWQKSANIFASNCGEISHTQPS